MDVSLALFVRCFGGKENATINIQLLSSRTLLLEFNFW